MGFQFVVMFTDSFMDDVIYIRDVEVCVERTICYTPGCICYGCKNFGLGSLHDDYVGLAGATPQFYSVATYKFDYLFVNFLIVVPCILIKSRFFSPKNAPFY